VKAEQNIPIAKLCVYTSIRFSEEIKCFLALALPEDASALP
jgi:hypothetical protein